MVKGIDMQLLTKRGFLGMAIGAIGGGLAFSASGQRVPQYLIDGLGGPGDDEGEAVARWTPAQIAELRRSGMTAWMVCIDDVKASPRSWENSIRKIAHYSGLIGANPDLFVHARTAADIRAAKAAGKTAMVFGTENTALIDSEMDRVSVLANLGVRVVQLTYNIRNMSGDGALEPANGGLSNFGRAMIARIEQEKLVLDLSHGGDRTILEAVAAAKRPMSIDHTGCRALGDHPRNVTDAAIRGVADKGGVVGIYLMPFLTVGRQPTREDVIAHIEHAVNVGGEDHVALGTDNFLAAHPDDEKTRAATRADYARRAAAGIAAPGENPDFFPAVRDYNSPLRFHMLADDLKARGWPAARIDKILGGNWLRFWDDVWGA